MILELSAKTSGLFTNPVDAASGPATAAFNGLHPKANSLVAHPFLLTWEIVGGVLAAKVIVWMEGPAMKVVSAIAEALERAAFWSEAREVTLLASDDVVNALWLKWLADFQLGRKRLLDTLIAVTWHAAGIREICSLNPLDFKEFDVLRMHCVGAEKSSA